jgi:toxin YhaV
VSTDPGSPTEINGWRIYAHPLFLDQLEALITEVEMLRRKDPQGYGSKNASKRLAAITRLMFQDIPQDPSRKEYLLGTTLGADHRHWRRAKFFQQFRLFFRFHARSRLIVLASGHPPGDWKELLQESEPASERLRKLSDRFP